MVAMVYGWSTYAIPRHSLVKRFPKSWRVDVIVIRSGGRDVKGNPLPAMEIPVNDCLIGARSTSDPLDRADVVDSTAVLYRDPGFTFLPSDRIRVPEGARMAGTWSVDGRPGEWPHGWEIALVMG